MWLLLIPWGTLIVDFGKLAAVFLFVRIGYDLLIEFYGARPQDVSLLLDLFEVQSTRNVRNQYLSATITAAERGTLSAAEVDANLTDLNFSDQAKHWVNLTIATRKQRAPRPPSQLRII